MKKLNQYLPFIIWSIVTIILTVIGFFILPVLLLLEQFNSSWKNEENSLTVNWDQKRLAANEHLLIGSHVNSGSKKLKP